MNDAFMDNALLSQENVAPGPAGSREKNLKDSGSKAEGLRGRSTARSESGWRFDGQSDQRYPLAEPAKLAWNTSAHCWYLLCQNQFR
jgi:hypothetical protein